MKRLLTYAAVAMLVIGAGYVFAADNAFKARISDGAGGTSEVTFGDKDLTTYRVPKQTLVDQAGAEVLGQVTASPTANTLGDRLKTIADLINVAGGTTVDTSVTRPADTNAYTANDVWADSTSAPTTGGFTLTSACRASGGTGLLTDMIVFTSTAPGTLLQGEIWLFDSSVTAVNDNAAFALSDSDVLKLVGVVSFTVVANPSNAHHHVTGINYGYKCSGSTNLRFLVKVKNAYTPGNAEVLTVRAKVIYND